MNRKQKKVLGWSIITSLIGCIFILFGVAAGWEIASALFLGMSALGVGFYLMKIAIDLIEG